MKVWRTVTHYLVQDKNGQVSVQEAVATVSSIFKDRKSLFNTLHDRENIARIITRTLGVLYWLLMIVVAMVMYGYSLEG